MKKISLTGIKPTGCVHLGNYIGAIKPVVELHKHHDYYGYYFIADYHALISLPSSDQLKSTINDLACAWIAAGLNLDQSLLYRQSDISEVCELQWILSCLCSKGLMNRAHAYKARVDVNKASKLDYDHGINIGLYTYPVLMAADILITGADVIPVGVDQLQHIEIARDLVVKFNHKYNIDKHHKVLDTPNAHINKLTGLLMGNDGKKMSKSANNQLALFCSSAQLKKWIDKIPTSSIDLGDPMEFSGVIVDLYKSFASESDIAQFKKYFDQGLGWGKVKAQLFNLVDDQLSKMRIKYLQLKKNPDYIESILCDGAEKVRPKATKVLKEVKRIIGL